MIKTLGCCDSGLGGLLVVDALHTAYPDLDIVFIADQSHVPYGDKSAEELNQYAHDFMQTFQKMGIHDVVIACNTLCAYTIDKIREDFQDSHIYSIIEPTVAQLQHTNYQKIRVIATSMTINKHVYASLLKKYCPSSTVEEIVASELVPIIENGCDEEKLKKAVEKLNPNPVDAWVLGCTHFPLIRPFLHEVDVYDSNQAIVSLFRQESFCGTGQVTIYTTKDKDQLKENIQKLLHKDYEVKSIRL